MEKVASHMTELNPDQFHYTLRVDQPFVHFNSAGTTFVPLSLSIGKGAALMLYGDGDYPIKIGGRIFLNEGTEQFPKRGEFIGESRVMSEPFVAQEGHRYSFSMPVNIPAEAPLELLLEIDLVQENCFWAVDRGYQSLTLVLTSRRIAMRPAHSDPTDMTEALMQLHDARARERRYEAVIFALLNQLPERDG